jgi:hypothetical protein
MVEQQKDHFQGKDALKHVVEVQAKGVLASTEVHGAETPGSLFAGADSARETAIILLLIALIVQFFDRSHQQILVVLAIFSVGFSFWKFGRASFLAWSRLERLHRVASEEQQEIIHNRRQEKEELKALYAAKGFQGKLLDDVIDVLMADEDRALRVMLQEELGFRLEENEHPLIQGFGAWMGVILSSLLVLFGYWMWGQAGAIACSAISYMVSSYVSTHFEHNRVVSAVIWNIGIAFFVYCTVFILMKTYVG